MCVLWVWLARMYISVVLGAKIKLEKKIHLNIYTAKHLFILYFICEYTVLFRVKQ